MEVGGREVQSKVLIGSSLNAKHSLDQSVGNVLDDIVFRGWKEEDI